MFTDSYSDNLTHIVLFVVYLILVDSVLISIITFQAKTELSTCILLWPEFYPLAVTFKV